MPVGEEAVGLADPDGEVAPIDLGAEADLLELCTLRRPLRGPLPLLLLVLVAAVVEDAGGRRVG
jgi:hypothetical protein